MTAAMMDPMPAPRTSVPPFAARSLFGSCLEHCARAGIRLVINAPADARVFGRGLACFPHRQINPPAHAHWESAYRVFCNRGRLPHDRGSWQLLAVDDDHRVTGAITARFFCGQINREYLHVFTLLESAGPVFREHCEKAVAELFASGARSGRTPAEISHWAIQPGPHAALVGATLIRAMSALASVFPAPLAITAADHRRGEVARLMRLGGAPLGCAGKFSLPPFVHHATGAWLRLILIDAANFQARLRTTPGDADLLRTRCAIFSAG